VVGWLDVRLPEERIDGNARPAHQLTAAKKSVPKVCVADITQGGV
jgi:hypothetical protein